MIILVFPLQISYFIIFFSAYGVIVGECMCHINYSLWLLHMCSCCNCQNIVVFVSICTIYRHCKWWFNEFNTLKLVLLECLFLASKVSDHVCKCYRYWLHLSLWNYSDGVLLLFFILSIYLRKPQWLAFSI